LGLNRGFGAGGLGCEEVEGRRPPASGSALKRSANLRGKGKHKTEGNNHTRRRKGEGREGEER